MSARIEKAKEICIRMHEGEERKHSGLPYHVHPFAVADTVRKAGGSEAQICAALLHDVPENCFDGDIEAGRDYISNYLGEDVAELTWQVTNQAKPEDGNRAARSAINTEHLSHATPEGQTIKLADFKDNTENLREENPEMAAYYILEKRKVLPLLKDGNPELYAEVHAILWAPVGAEIDTSK